MKVLYVETTSGGLTIVNKHDFLDDPEDERYIDDIDYASLKTGVKKEDLVLLTEEVFIDKDKIKKNERKAIIDAARAERLSKRKSAGDKFLTRNQMTDEEFKDLFGFWINEPQ